MILNTTVEDDGISVELRVEVNPGAEPQRVGQAVAGAINAAASLRTQAVTWAENERMTLERGA